MHGLIGHICIVSWADSRPVVVVQADLQHPAHSRSEKLSPKIPPQAKFALQHLGRVAVALREHMESGHACAGGQEAAPEQTQAEEAGALLDGEEQAPNRRCKGCGNACMQDVALCHDSSHEADISSLSWQLLACLRDTAHVAIYL